MILRKERVMGDHERLSAVEVALGNEKREREFYLRHAQRTKNQVGKAMFQQIADEELEHYQRLKELHEKWEKREKWPETVPLRVKDTIVKDVLKDVVAKVDEAREKDDDDLQAIRTALDFEAKGAAHYAKLRDEVSDPKEKEFFDLLSRIEREHYVSLKDTEEYLIDPAAWFTKTERHGLDGA
jgi:rubrerythrin